MTATKKEVEYLILSLHHTKISLIKVEGSNVREITDDNFPMTLEKSPGISVPWFSFGNILRGFVTDKSIIGEVRFAGFLRTADERLKGYLKKDDSLVIAGAEGKLKEFDKITINHSHVVGEIVGHHTDHNRNDWIRKFNGQLKPN